jgi:adenine-specific DNA-methyltransferase
VLHSPEDFHTISCGELDRFDVETLGQVFTPQGVVSRMIDMSRHSGRADWRVLEPSCGNGAFLSRIPTATGIEIDPKHCPDRAINIDFFQYQPDRKFHTIIGNPPFVKFRNISPDTRGRLDLTRLDRRSNLYLFFIDRCLDHLEPDGEMIFITPRDFLKTTSSRHLNEKMLALGTITHFEDLGDDRIFKGYGPNCAIWRFQMGDLSHRLADGRKIHSSGGQLSFSSSGPSCMLGEFFDVKVGGATGADHIFSLPLGPTREVVGSKTIDTGRGRLMVYGDYLPRPPEGLIPYEAELRARRMRHFGDNNWWHWGRQPSRDHRPRVYVNNKTRRERPFFTHASPYFDGSVFALLLKDVSLPPSVARDALNAIDWAGLGFRSGSRYIFSQRSLSTAPLPDSFAESLSHPGLLAAE